MQLAVYCSGSLGTCSRVSISVSFQTKSKSKKRGSSDIPTEKPKTTAAPRRAVLQCTAGTVLDAAEIPTFDVCSAALPSVRMH